MGTNYSPRIVTDGLVLCLDAGDIKSYSGSGATWNDRSGNESDATLYNSPTFTTNNGGSLNFDGSNDYGKTSTNTEYRNSQHKNLSKVEGETQ